MRSSGFWQDCLSGARQDEGGGEARFLRQQYSPDSLGGANVRVLQLGRSFAYAYHAGASCPVRFYSPPEQIDPASLWRHRLLGDKHLEEARWRVLTAPITRGTRRF